MKILILGLMSAVLFEANATILGEKQTDANRIYVTESTEFDVDEYQSLMVSRGHSMKIIPLISDNKSIYLSLKYSRRIGRQVHSDITSYVMYYIDDKKLYCDQKEGVRCDLALAMFSHGMLVASREEKIYFTKFLDCKKFQEDHGTFCTPF